ncbi:MAG: OmpA family protein [Gemmatimonadota bacterium]|nr:OmpA family protein [Gemmatimonadota bacterium]
MRYSLGNTPLSIVALAATLPALGCAMAAQTLTQTAMGAAESEATAIVDQEVRQAIRCAIDDPICVRDAEEAGEEVVYVDDEGEVITDDAGMPITSPDEAPAQAAPPAPGEGAWANYDFVPGDEVLFYEDFSADNVGDFPRRLEFVSGNWEVVEWEGRTILRNTGPRHAAFKVPLPEELPSRFTVELQAYLPHGNQQMVITTAAPEAGSRWASVGGNAIQVAAGGQPTGVVSSDRGGTESTNKTPVLTERLVPIRVMVDDRYAKVYVEEHRVANIPNAEFVRGDALYFENTYFADEANPMLIGWIRIAAGGADLYGVLEAEGRVATRGILFATNSDRIRPESTPTLEEIASMLTDHPDLRISIEGHTDSDGEDAYNQDLSERRAASVKRYLTEKHGIDDGRLETAGLGESSPVADNATPEGKQQNRRVELVRLADDDETEGGDR